MKLLTRHAFPFTPEQFWDCFWDPEWEAAETEHSDMRREVISQTEVDGVVTLHQRYHTNIKLPGPVAGRMGADTLSYEQISTIDKRAGTLSWKVIPPAMQDKVVAQGAMRVVATPTGCERIVEGEVTVKVPLFGGKIEKGVVEGITTGHETEAKRRLAWMKARY